VVPIWAPSFASFRSAIEAASAIEDPADVTIAWLTS